MRKIIFLSFVCFLLRLNAVACIKLTDLHGETRLSEDYSDCLQVIFMRQEIEEMDNKITQKLLSGTESAMKALRTWVPKRNRMGEKLNKLISKCRSIEVEPILILIITVGEEVIQ